jgi:hypothetical protein
VPKAAVPKAAMPKAAVPKAAMPKAAVPKAAVPKAAVVPMQVFLQKSLIKASLQLLKERGGGNNFLKLVRVYLFLRTQESHSLRGIYV